MPNLIFLCGIPASGKSTFAAECQKNGGNAYTIVSTDEIRKSKFGNAALQYDDACRDIAIMTGVSPYTVGNNFVYGTAVEEIVHSLSCNKTVLFDATNISVKNRKSVLEKVVDSVPNTKAFAIVFNTSLDECLRRNAERTVRVVPVGVIKRMHDTFEMPTKDEGFVEITTIQR
jgi:predicted kinase